MAHYAIYLAESANYIRSGARQNDEQLLRSLRLCLKERTGPLKKEINSRESIVRIRHNSVRSIDGSETELAHLHCFPSPNSAGSSRSRTFDESELVAAAQTGDVRAMEHLFARYRGGMYRAAARLTSSPEEAEDVVQEAMLRAFQNISRFRKESRLATWLTAIVNNTALSLKRRASRVRWTSFEDAPEGAEGTRTWEPPDLRRTPEEQILHEEMHRALAATIELLPEDHRAILQASVYNDNRMADVASEFGLTVASVKSRLYVARRRLEKALALRGFVRRNRQSKFASAYKRA